MIINSTFSRSGTFLHEMAATGGGNPISVQSTVYVVSEYFVSASQPLAKSVIDYLASPTEQIRSQLNAWLASLGDQTRIECDDATWVVAPAAQITKEFVDSYEPFVRAVTLYRARLDQWNDEDSGIPSQMQATAALLGMANLMAWLVPAPSPMVLEDGTIGGYWRRGKSYVSIDFEVDGAHSWAGTDGENFHSGTWKLPGDPLPPVLVSELRSIVY